MYDYFIGRTKFDGFIDKINDILEGTYKEDIEKLGNDIYEACSVLPCTKNLTIHATVLTQTVTQTIMFLSRGGHL